MNTSTSHNVFPVALLLKDHRCLVVGGGKVATRKVEMLLHVQASVTVVAPDLSPTLKALADQGAFVWLARRFEPMDLDDVMLVYAATNQNAVNRVVLNLCQVRGILCCPVDHAWQEGDFLTPATVRDSGLTVAVHSAGHACRRSRLVKESISKHIDLISRATLMVIGISHEQSSMTVRESLQAVENSPDATARWLSELRGLHEFSLLSTCNRLELHAVGIPDETSLSLIKKLLGFDCLDPEQVYVKTGWEAFEHACVLCAGLLSQMPYEYHIVSQMKSALQTALDHEWAGGRMQEWMNAVLHVAAHVRKRYDGNSDNREFEDAALSFLQKTRRSPDRLFLLGGGAVGRSFLTRALQKLPLSSVDWFWHRRRPELPSFVGDVPVVRHRLDQLKDLLPQADVLVTALQTDEPVVTKALWDEPRSEPLTVVDFGMPRNVSPEVASTLPAGSHVLDLDALKQWQGGDASELERWREQCRQRVAEHKAYYDKLITSFQGGIA